MQVNDIREARIDCVLEEMSEMVLCSLPNGDPWSIDFFTVETQVWFAVILFPANLLSVRPISKTVSAEIVLFLIKRN